MREIKEEVVVYRVEALCDFPCNGKMVYDGVCLMSLPPRYPHKCENCGKFENLDHIYPRKVTEVKP